MVSIRLDKIKYFLSTHYSLLFIIMVAGIGSYYFFGWPVSGGADTDLWYHLNGGRYFFRNMTPADSGFFSFIGENRIWTNYYWFFQVLVYSIYSTDGYSGLVLFRGLMFLGFTGSISYFLLRNEKSEICKFYFSLVPVLLLLVFIPRFFAMVRPHMFSYLFIVLFLVFFESKNKRLLFFLPFLAVLWTNVHGVEYPVMLLICFAYLAEILWRSVRIKDIDNHDSLRQLVPIVLIAAGLFVSPWGVNLLFVPFESAQFQTAYIADMRQAPFTDFLYFSFQNVNAAFISFSNFLLFLILLSFLVGIKGKNIRLSHCILLIGSWILLIRGERFRYEAILLGLPTLKDFPLIIYNQRFGDFVNKYKAALFALAAVGAFFFFSLAFEARARFPMSEDRLPTGISKFLNQLDVGGRILNHPNHGGYLEWELDNRYLIAMDFELMLFNDADVFTVANSFTNPHVLAKFINHYRPGFIIPMLANNRFAELISSFPDYIDIFYDDVGVLYVDKKQHPQIAERYNLDFIKPFKLRDIDFSMLPEKEVEGVLDELLFIYKIYPDGLLVNQMLAQLYNRSENRPKSLEHAENICLNFPEKSTGYLLAGNIYFADQRFSEALQKYSLALAKENSGGKLEIYKKISACYLAINDFSNGYKFLKKGIETFSSATSYEDYYNLGRLAIQMGDIRDSVMFLEFALLMLPEGNQEMHQQILLQFAKAKNMTRP